MLWNSGGTHLCVMESYGIDYETVGIKVDSHSFCYMNIWQVNIHVGSHNISRRYV